VIIADTSGLLSLLDRGEPEHSRVLRVLQARPGPLLVTDFVLAETDYLILKRLGAKAERDFVDQLNEGVLVREAVTGADLRRAAEILGRYPEHDLGLTDATVMAVAERLKKAAVLTLDRRHFSVFRTRGGQALTLLPD
jgi:predicted nucleic acid-binding protein